MARSLALTGMMYESGCASVQDLVSQANSVCRLVWYTRGPDALRWALCAQFTPLAIHPSTALAPPARTPATVDLSNTKLMSPHPTILPACLPLQFLEGEAMRPLRPLTKGAVEAVKRTPASVYGLLAAPIVMVLTLLLALPGMVRGDGKQRGGLHRI